MTYARMKFLDELMQKIHSIFVDLETCLDNENKFLADIPENLHDSEEYETSVSACNCMENAIESLDEVFV